MPPTPTKRVTPPQQRRSEDEHRWDDVMRRIEEIVERLDRMQATQETTYVRQDVYAQAREVTEMALGGVKVDIRRIDEAGVENKRKLEAAEAEMNRRFRSMVYAIFASVGGPLTVYLVIRSLTAGAV